MRTIHKYQITELLRAVIVEMPKGAHVIAVAEQRGVLCLWAEVDDNEPLEARTFCLVRTGNPLQGDEGRHLGTAICNGGALVWHVYE